MEILILMFIPLVVAAWVFSDAVSRGKDNGTAILWFLGVFLLLIVFLPLWFISRPKKESEVVIVKESKICQECGKYFEGTPSFCPNCGEPVLAKHLEKVSAPHMEEKKEFKTCPDCAETIAKMARLCKHCGRRFDEEVDALELQKNLEKQEKLRKKLIEEQEALKESEKLLIKAEQKKVAKQTLLEKGIKEINSFNSNNLTPLMEYAIKNDKETVELLLIAGANKYERNMAGFTAADKASQEGHLELAEYIRDYE